MKHEDHNDCMCEICSMTFHSEKELMDHKKKTHKM